MKSEPVSEIQPEKLLVNAAAAANMLSIGRSTFWVHVRTGKLPQPVHIGGLTRWRVADLRQHVVAAS